MTNYELLTIQLIDLLNGDVLPLPTWGDMERNEERIALAVQETTDLSRAEWMAMDGLRRETWLQKTIDTLRSLSVAEQIDSDSKDWMIATEALTQLPFLGTALKDLYQFAKDYPDKLRMRRAPKHGRRRQVHRADVQRLAAEHEARQLEALDSPAADNLPPLAEVDLRPLADRMNRERAGKRRKK